MRFEVHQSSEYGKSIILGSGNNRADFWLVMIYARKHDEEWSSHVYMSCVNKEMEHGNMIDSQQIRAYAKAIEAVASVLERWDPASVSESFDLVNKSESVYGSGGKS